MEQNYKIIDVNFKVFNGFWNQLNKLLTENKYTTSELKLILTNWSKILGVPLIATWEYKKLCEEAKNIIKALNLSADKGDIYNLLRCLEVLIDDTKFTALQLNEFLRRNGIECYYDSTEAIWKKVDNQNRIGGPTMEIFLGSSSEAKDFMEDVALKLQELGCDTLMWTDTGKGIFVPGTNTIDALIEITKRVEAAIFIFNADDKTWNKNSSLEGASTVRDNVLFEYGLFTGALGKKKVCFVCKDHPEVATDLKGITYIDGNQKSLIIKNKLKDWINAM